MSTQKPSTEQNPADNGEAMVLAFYERKPKDFQPVILVGPMEEPSKMRELKIGGWHNRLQKARLEGMRMYFDAYEDRYRFKHPEDPTRSRFDGPLPYTVVCTNSESSHEARTYDPDRTNLHF